ncbi:MAG: NADH:flavin oxidoreductase [Dehalococcoidales bacterium]|nr:NADH:flavin oxidoreductase [Dehalococcoidales bacterium]
MIDLFQPFQIGKLQLANRFVRSATWDGTADEEGAVTEASLAIYEKLGQGGIGLIVSGHVYVDPYGQAGFGQYGIHSDKMEPGLRKMAAAVHRSGGKIAIQIAHCGIQTTRRSPRLMVVSQDPASKREQHEMSDSDIEALINTFAQAAVRAKEAGFDAVQLHGAHGYLLSQFLSPLTNRRNDRWGGNIENRSRFHLEVIRRIRQAVGRDYPLLIKFGVRDESDDGLSIEEGITTAERMCEAGIDAIEISFGYSPNPSSMTTLKPGEPPRAFFRDRAAAVKQAVKVPVILVAGIRSMAMAKEIVNSGDADMISMSRPFIQEPGLLKRWQNNAGGTSDCISCNRCFPPLKPDGRLVVCRKKESSGV